MLDIAAHRHVHVVGHHGYLRQFVSFVPGDDCRFVPYGHESLVARHREPAVLNHNYHVQIVPVPTMAGTEGLGKNYACIRFCKLAEVGLEARIDVVAFPGLARNITLDDLAGVAAKGTETDATAEGNRGSGLPQRILQSAFGAARGQRRT